MSEKRAATDEKDTESIETESTEKLHTSADTPIEETSGTVIYYETDGTVLGASDVDDTAKDDDDDAATKETEKPTTDAPQDSSDDDAPAETRRDEGAEDDATTEPTSEASAAGDTDDATANDDDTTDADDDADNGTGYASDVQEDVSGGVPGDENDDKDESASDGDATSEAPTDDEIADTKEPDGREPEDDDEDDDDIECPTGWGPAITKDERDYVTIKGYSFKPLTLCKVFAALTVAPLAVSCGLSFAHMVANFELGFWHYLVAACIYGALLVACLYSIGSFVAANDRYDKAMRHCVTYDELSMLIEERGINIVGFGFFSILSLVASIVVGVIMFCIF